MTRIRKELDVSNGDYKGTAARKSHSDYCDKKRTPKSVGEIQAMIDNDLNKSISRDIGMSEAGNIWSHPVLLIPDKKDQDKRKDCTAKLFNKLKHLQSNMLGFFSDEKIFCQDQMVNPQKNYTDCDEMQTPSPHHTIWGGYSR